MLFQLVLICFMSCRAPIIIVLSVYKQQQLHTYLWFLPVPAEHNKVIVNIVKWTLIHILSNDRSRNIRVQMLSFSHCRKLRDQCDLRLTREAESIASQSDGYDDAQTTKPQPLFNHLRGKLKYEATRCN